MKLYDTWERYNTPSHPKHKYHVARHNWFVKNICGEKLLDIGCAGGLLLFLAAKLDYIKELWGIDINEKSIEQAQGRIEKSGKKICLAVGNAENIPFEINYFDCITCGETLEHLRDDISCIQQAYRLLKIGGTYLVSVPDRGHTSIQHLRLYTRTSLYDKITNAGFKVVGEDRMKASVNGYYLLLKAIKV